MAPEQARILPISEHQAEAANALCEKAAALGLRVTVDQRDEKIGKKIREAQMEKIPYMLVLGDREIESGSIALRARGVGVLGTVPEQDVLDRLVRENAERTLILPEAEEA